MKNISKDTEQAALFFPNKPIFFGLIGALVLIAIVVFVYFSFIEKSYRLPRDTAVLAGTSPSPETSAKVEGTSATHPASGFEYSANATHVETASFMDSTPEGVNAPDQRIAPPTEHTSNDKEQTANTANKNLPAHGAQTTSPTKTKTVPTPQSVQVPQTLNTPQSTYVPAVIQDAKQKTILLSLPTWFDSEHWETIHIVEPGETLFSLAQKYYGDGRLYPYLALKNNLSEASVLKSGIQLKIVNPAFLWHKVQSGETLYSIAKQFYGDGKLVQRLIEANGIEDVSMLPAGSELIIPAPDLIVYVVKPGDTWMRISERLFGSKAYADAIMKQQRFPNDYTLKVGDTLFITMDETLSVALKKQPEPIVLSELGLPSTYRLVAERSAYLLKVYENDRLIKVFPIAVGRLGDETPEGQYKIITKLEKPYYRAKKIAGGDPQNPLGSHWLGLDVPGTDGSIYGLHGTNDPGSIGKNVSAGCIRLYNEDVKWLYDHLPLGTDVTIR